MPKRNRWRPTQLACDPPLRRDEPMRVSVTASLRGAHRYATLPDRSAWQRALSWARAIDTAADAVYESYDQCDMRNNKRKKSCTLFRYLRSQREVRN